MQEKLEKDFYLEVHFLVKSACKKNNKTLSPKLNSRPVYCLGLCGMYFEFWINFSKKQLFKQDTSLLFS